MKTRIGSNQFQKKYKGLQIKTWYSIYFLTLLIALTCFLGNQYEIAQQGYISPLPMSPNVEVATYKQPELAPLNQRTAVISLIKRIWGKDAPIGLQLAKCESGYRTNAVNHNTDGTVDLSVFQVNSSHQMPDMDNATANILYAYKIYQEQGTTPWNSSRSCWGSHI